MKVGTLIARLRRNYDLDQDVMAFVIGSEYKESKAGVFERAVEIWDSEDILSVFQDYLNDLYIDAEFQVTKDEQAEDAVDSYLNDLAEAELNEQNV
jgi:hypothetical protein